MSFTIAILSLLLSTTKYSVLLENMDIIIAKIAWMYYVVSIRKGLCSMLKNYSKQRHSTKQHTTTITLESIQK